MKTKFKKLHIFTLFICSAVLCACVFPLPSDAHVSVDTDYADENYVPVDGTPILYESTVPEEDIIEAVAGWVLVPESLQAKLAEYGYTMYITTAADPYNDGVAASYPAGVRVDSDGTILFRHYDPYTVVSTTSNNLTSTVAHEVGHILDTTIALCESGVYDGSYYKLSDSTEWQELYEAYYDTMINLDHRTSYVCILGANEAFAEMFRVYCEMPETLSALMPEIYVYIEDALLLYT